MFVYLFKSIGTQTRERKGIVIGKSIPLSLGTKIVPSEESNRERENREREFKETERQLRERDRRKKGEKQIGKSKGKKKREKE